LLYGKAEHSFGCRDQILSVATPGISDATQPIVASAIGFADATIDILPRL
jgi:hypothetical protein